MQWSNAIDFFLLKILKIFSTNKNGEGELDGETVWVLPRPLENHIKGKSAIYPLNYPLIIKYYLADSILLLIINKIRDNYPCISVDIILWYVFTDGANRATSSQRNYNKHTNALSWKLANSYWNSLTSNKQPHYQNHPSTECWIKELFLIFEHWQQY